MGVKGYRLWDIGQMNSTCRAPPLLPWETRAATAVGDVARDDDLDDDGGRDATGAPASAPEPSLEMIASVCAAAPRRCAAVAAARRAALASPRASSSCRRMAPKARVVTLGCRIGYMDHRVCSGVHTGCHQLNVF
jgi:hypothetical protein